MGYIYLDHNSTAPLYESVPRLNLEDHWANASSIHMQSRKPKKLLREARSNISKLIGAKTPLEIIFTSGGSESNNQVVKGVFFDNLIHKNQKNHYICGVTEHPSTIKAFEFIKKLGANVEFIPEDKSGKIDLELYDQMITPKTALVFKMLANSETGIIYPIKKMAKLARSKGVLFCSDCVQGLGKTKFSVSDLDLDFATFASHKFYALKGCGVTYIKTGVTIEPLIHGGGQERTRRAGTENILSIASFGEVAKKDFSEPILEMEKLRNYLEENLDIEGLTIIGKNSKRICNTSNFIIDGIDSETVLINLDIMGFAVSAGTACSSGRGEPSQALINMGYLTSEASRSIRVSLGIETTKKDIDKFIKALREVVKRVRDAYLIANSS